MFCARCGQQIPDATQLCPLCGRESTIQLSPSAPAQSTTPAAAAMQTAAMNGPQGVGGWLLFFCVVITVLAPIGIFFRLKSLGPDRWLSRVDIIETIRILYGMVVGFFLWVRSHHALMLLRIYFVFVGSMVLLRALGAISATMRMGWNTALLISDFKPFLPVIGSTVLWVAYFHTSKRVRNTYGANL